VKAQIALRGGAVLAVDVADLSVDHDGPGRQITAIRYHHDQAGGNLLAAIVPSEIIAVVILDAPPQMATHPSEEAAT
jgi:hypothetical protein